MFIPFYNTPVDQQGFNDDVYIGVTECERLFAASNEPIFKTDMQSLPKKCQIYLSLKCSTPPPNILSCLRIVIHLSLAITIVAIATASCYAVNYCDGAHAPEGAYFLTYSYWYGADKLADDNGGNTTRDLEMNKYAVSFRPVYYGKNYVVHAILPIVGLNVGYLHGRDTNLGDIIVGAGYFLPVKDIDILPVVHVKFPSGHFDSSKSVNSGDGQYDLRPELYVHKVIGKLTIDAALKYWIRFKNPNTTLKPGNEFYAEGVAVYELFKGFRLGPSVAFSCGRQNEIDGTELPDSEVTKLSIGGEFVYSLTSKMHLTVDAIPDIYARNSPKGMLILGRFCYSF